MIFSMLLRISGGLCLFLYGMKLMSDGIQKSAGDRLRKTLSFMTGNRYVAVLTGIAVTGVIQSSSAVTIMVVSFVNAGLLTLTQSIGVIMGANIGTTVTAWIVSLIGFSINISAFALPAVGVGFVLSVIKWKYKSAGELVLGFGLLFLGLNYLTTEMQAINNYIDFSAVSAFDNVGFTGILIGAGAGLVMTFLIHSSSASTAIVLTMAFNNILSYEMAASMVLGANIGTTIDAVLAAIGARTAAKRAALVHVLFNVIGTLWALPLIRPLLSLVDYITPGNPVAGDPAMTMHIAMLHTVFNGINTLLFLPFVKQFAALVSIIIREDPVKDAAPVHYRFAYISGTMRDTPELNIVRAEKEIRDMAGIASLMYARICEVLRSLRESENREEAVTDLVEKLKVWEEYADEMRETLTSVLFECTRVRLNFRSEQKVSRLIRVIADLEDMTDHCYVVGLLLEKSVRKDHVFKNKEMTALVPYISLVEDSLVLVQNHLGKRMNAEQAEYAKEMEEKIVKSRNKLRKLSRKRIESGANLKTELLFIDMVRSIEKIGDYSFHIVKAVAS